MCNEVEVVNKFIDEYLSNDENIEPISSIKKNSIYCAGKTISSLEIQSHAVVEQKINVSLNEFVIPDAGSFQKESYSNHQDTHSTVVLGIPSVESTLRETKAQFNSAHGRRHMNSQIFVHCLC
ncbi:hypothetical protein QL285_008876 [Trifolium repens]|nr:hypothetical protein QL285_008876 [Trifolium repens]